MTNAVHSPVESTSITRVTTDFACCRRKCYGTAGISSYTWQISGRI